MQDVAHMTSQDDGFLLFGLFGEQKFVRGKIKHIDFVDQHTVVLEDE
jgi:predicted RNA-binding protein